MSPFYSVERDSFGNVENIRKLEAGEQLSFEQFQVTPIPRVGRIEGVNKIIIDIKLDRAYVNLDPREQRDVVNLRNGEKRQLMKGKRSQVRKGSITVSGQNRSIEWREE